MIEKSCLVCGNATKIQNRRAQTFRCCSRACLARYFQRKTVTKTCAQCGTEFRVGHYHAATAKYCSRNCYRKGMRGRGHITFICEHCGKSFKGSPSRVGSRRFCSSRCYGLSMRSDVAPTAKYRKHVFEERPRKCERCGYSTTPAILVVHHKDRNRRNHAPSNLEVLCPNCHAEEHWRKHDGQFTRKKRKSGKK